MPIDYQKQAKMMDEKLERFNPRNNTMEKIKEPVYTAKEGTPLAEALKDNKGAMEQIVDMIDCVIDKAQQDLKSTILEKIEKKKEDWFNSKDFYERAFTGEDVYDELSNLGLEIKPL